MHQEFIFAAQVCSSGDKIRLGGGGVWGGWERLWLAKSSLGETQAPENADRKDIEETKEKKKEVLFNVLPKRIHVLLLT